ncbi:MAG: cation transporter dimerization domain-containing protein, partial [Candidatus Bathyarchaeia archaeon]
ITVKAGFYHALADLGSTLIALLGFGLATLGYPIFDTFASIILSTAIGYLSLKLLKASGMELSDAISKETADKIRRDITTINGISKVENIRVRKVGAKTFVEATIQVPSYMNLEEAHKLASKIEDNLRHDLGNAEVLIHVEPLEKEVLTGKIVEKIAREVEEVKEVHEVNSVYAHGKLYITLHVRVDPKLSVQEAHKLAEKIEEKLNEKFENIGNVTVHIEPFEAGLRRGSALDEHEIREVVQNASRSFGQILKIRRVVTYVADEKRYINIDCCFIKQISVKDAHKIASQIERNLKRLFTETIVTIHIDPE